MSDDLAVCLIEDNQKLREEIRKLYKTIELTNKYISYFEYSDKAYLSLNENSLCMGVDEEDRELLKEHYYGKEK